MSERFDTAVWAGLEQRLAEVEGLIPETPPWQPSTAPEPNPRVRLGPALRPVAASRPRRSPFVLVVAVLVLLLTLIAGAFVVGSFMRDPGPEQDPFGSLGALRQGDGDNRAARLADGRTIVVSGEWRGFGTARARADTWDPVAGVVSIDPPTIPRVNPTTTLLLDGRVLVVGGYGGPYQYASSAIASAEVWDPVTSTFLPTGSMAAARVGHTATLLPDGRVLVVGGAGPQGEAAEAEMWDPQTDAFSPAGTLGHPRMGHAATLLLDGRVIVAGGLDPMTGDGFMAVEVWDPSTRSFIGAIALFDAPKAMSLTRLASGSVMMAGAFVAPGGYRGVVFWRPSGAAREDSVEMAQHRDGHTATLLPDGRVMVAGGRSPTGDVLDSVELWDPADGLFHDTAPLSRPVANHTALLLADGRVLIVPDGTGPDGVVEPFLYEPEGIR